MTTTSINTTTTENIVVEEKDVLVEELNQGNVNVVGFSSSSYTNMYEEYMEKLGEVATKGNLIKLKDIIKTITNRAERIAKWHQDAQKGLKEDIAAGKNRVIWDANVLKMKLASEFANFLVNRANFAMETLNEKIANHRSGEMIEIWKMLADHQIVNKPWFGPFSKMDEVIIITRSTPSFSATKSLPKDMQARGISTIKLPNYGLIVPHPKGYCLQINGEEEIWDAIDLHKQIVNNDKTQYIQRIAYDIECVIPSSKKIEMNGFTMVTQHKDRGLIRISMSEPVYAAIIWSVAHAAYGKKRSEYNSPLYVNLHQIMMKITGKTHIPSNEVEFAFFDMNRSIFNSTDKQKEKTFSVGGRLTGITEDSLSNFAEFAKLYPEHVRRIEARKEQARLAREEQAQNSKPAGPSKVISVPKTDSYEFEENTPAQQNKGVDFKKRLNNKKDALVQNDTTPEPPAHIQDALDSMPTDEPQPVSSSQFIAEDDEF